MCENSPIPWNAWIRWRTSKQSSPVSPQVCALCLSLPRVEGCAIFSQPSPANRSRRQTHVPPPDHSRHHPRHRPNRRLLRPRPPQIRHRPAHLRLGPPRYHSRSPLPQCHRRSFRRRSSPRPPRRRPDLYRPSHQRHLDLLPGNRPPRSQARPRHRRLQHQAAHRASCRREFFPAGHRALPRRPSHGRPRSSRHRPSRRRPLSQRSLRAGHRFSRLARSLHMPPIATLASPPSSSSSKKSAPARYGSARNNTTTPSAWSPIFPNSPP